MNRTALLFPGQGSQYVGMGQDIYKSSSIVRETFEEAEETVGIELSKICFEDNNGTLTSTEIAQPAILTLSVAQFRLLNERYEINPSLLAGHSLGEYSALCCSEVFSFSDALKIVQKRGQLMKDTSQMKGTMAAVIGIDSNEVTSVCLELLSLGHIVGIGAYNSLTQCSISGEKKAVEMASTRLKKMGGTVIPLNVSGAFHSSLMNEAATELRKTLEKYRFSRMKWPVLSNVTGEPHHGVNNIIDNLVLQMTAPVQWIENMNYLLKKNITHAIELGPGTVLNNLSKEFNGLEVYSYDTEKDAEILINLLTPEEDRLAFIGRALATAVCIKNNNDDVEQYKLGVIEPYQRIKEMYLLLEKKQETPTMEQLKETIEMLLTVIQTKKADMQECNIRIKSLLYETGTKDLLKEINLPFNLMH
ncbi:MULTISPECIES: ACP S-malonyltransferase [unclassified Niallia]|uniref:ACP S-malonyltransferase n=1 Tax=unclassified Niallia TaxID=2837522 RepID=UPI0030F89D6D